jgi:small subunit ribosomal protein S20
MPNKHAAIKDLRKSQKRQAHNNRIKTNIKALTKQLDELAKAGKTDELKALASKLQQAVAKAAKENVFHKNRASRKTSKAMKKAFTKAK